MVDVLGCSYLMRLDELGLLDELPDEVQRRNEDLHGVLLEEVGDVPGRVAGVAVVA